MEYFDALLTLAAFLVFFTVAGLAVLVAGFVWELRQDRKPRERVDLSDQTWRAGR